MEFTKPLVVQYQSGKGAANDGHVHQSGDVMTVPMQLEDWNEFKNTLVANYESGNYDSTIISSVGLSQQDKNDPRNIQTMDIRNNEVVREADKVGNRVFNRFNKQLYFINPTFDEKKSMGKNYAPTNQEVLDKYNKYSDKLAWQGHQARIIQKFKATMPLTTGQPWERSNHKAMLKEPKRGLHDEDLKDFFSWQANKPIVPELFGDDMVGMPAVKATKFNDIKLSYHGKEIDSTPISLQTVGLEGYMIPMRNTNGDSAKYQVGADVSRINLLLKARAADGVSIQKSEYYDKNTGVYKFDLDGKPSNLQVDYADNDKIVMSDTKGQFEIEQKKDIKPLLEERGYEIPELIDNLKAQPQSKYIWMSKGTMAGVDKGSRKDMSPLSKVNTLVSPSEAGFISARAPKNGSKDYVVVVAEGALKGTIAAKYFDTKDKTGKSVGDEIAGDKGIIVSQVPGVAEAFVKSVDRIYDDPKLKGHIAGTYIAMDADGRDNKNVCTGIHSAFDELKQHNDGKVKIMSWDPAQKGIDDSLLAIANGKITVDDMDIHFGTPEKLFPLDKAKSPNPYKLDGERVNSTWKTESLKNLKKTEEKIASAQDDYAPKNEGVTEKAGATQPKATDEPELDLSGSLDDLSKNSNRGLQP